ncbi:uncharacterized protein LOC142606356 [Castanea sativa]|uniref:uncharacterized protein LOC142606356 n=1 Tax=Castanea sativa TaxID=21020 RepID=UPI003F64C5AF
MVMREGKTLKTYTNRYWEMFNEIDGDFDDVAIRTFKVGLPAEHGLRKSLTGKPVSCVRQFMNQIDKYKQVEEDQQSGKGKVKEISQDIRDFRLDKYAENCPWRDFTRYTGAGIVLQGINTVFREPVHQILEKIKNESYFRWPNKMNGDPTRRNQNLHCTQGNTSSRPSLGTVNVIFATPGRADSCPSWVMTVARPLSKNSNHGLKRAKIALQLALSFLEKDKFGNIQPHDDALVVTLRIGSMT